MIVFCILHFAAYTQKPCELFISDVEGHKIAGLPVFVPKVFVNKSECLSFVNKLPSLLVIEGYASASIDTINEFNDNIYIKLFIGEKFKWDNVKIDDNNRQFLEQLGYSGDRFSQKPFQQNMLMLLNKNVLEWCSNNGYPFANIFLDSLVINKEKISGRLHINKGAPYFIDSIVIDGGVKVTRNFLEKYIGLASHSLYRQDKIDNIKQKLSILSFLQLSQPVKVEMLNTGAIVHLQMQALRSNSINILIGLLPNNSQNNGKLLFTGDANIGLRNSFGKGETIGINWQQLQPQSPRLKLGYEQPYILNSSFGGNFNFELYKRDSFFLNIKSQIGLQRELAPNQTGLMILQLATTNILSIDTNVVKATNRLPDMADVHSANILLQYNFFNTNYRFNPVKGNEINFIISAGNKKIKKNNSIVQIKDPLFYAAALYDSLKLNTYQFRLQTSISHYFRTGKQSTIKTSINTGWYQSPNYFLNEMFQIGGFKTLRGFDEESIFTNRYSIATSEYRYLIDKNSWLYGFTDFAYVVYKSNNINFSNTYLGLGLGLSLETNAGLLNIAFAQGKKDNSKFDFGKSKIHIGFVSLF